MLARTKRLRRLATLYGIVEELRSLERDRAALAVFTTEQAVVEQAGVASQALQRGRQALSVADRQDALLHEAEREVARFNTERLSAQQKEYERIEQEAAEQHRLALLQQDQMETLLRGMRARLAELQGRREQAIADDRFSARAHWLANRAARRLKNS